MTGQLQLATIDTIEDEDTIDTLAIEDEDISGPLAVTGQLFIARVSWNFHCHLGY